MIWMFSDVPTPEKFERVLDVGLAISILCAIFHLGFLVKLIHHGLLWGKEATRGVKKNRKILIINVACSFFCEGMVIFGLVLKLDSEACSLFGRLPAVFYITAHFATYMVLLNRLESVQVYVSQTRREAFLVHAVNLATMSVPLLSLSCLFVFEGRLFFKEGHCIQVFNGTIVWAFTILDSILSLGYLLLFLAPVFKHVRILKGFRGEEVGSGREGEIFAKVARKNLYLSLITIISTFVHLICVSIAGITIQHDNSPKASTWLLSEYISGPLDMVINTGVNLILMKSSWTRQDNRNIIYPALSHDSSM